MSTFFYLGTYPTYLSNFEQKRSTILFSSSFSNNKIIRRAYVHVFKEPMHNGIMHHACVIFLGTFQILRGPYVFYYTL